MGIFVAVIYTENWEEYKEKFSLWMGNRMITYHQVVQRSPEWFELRKGLWTGSIAIKLLQGKSMPPESDFTGNYYTKRGQALEPLAIAEYERVVKRHVARPGFVTNSVYPNGGFFA